MPVLTRVVLNSRNAKVGKSACVYRTQASCPATCPLMGSGCYGENRAHGGQSLFDVPARNGAADYADVLALIDRIPRNGLLRLNVVGDFLAANGEPDAAYIDGLQRSRYDTPRHQDHRLHARLAQSGAGNVRVPGQRLLRERSGCRASPGRRLASGPGERRRCGRRDATRRAVPRRTSRRDAMRHLRRVRERQADPAGRELHRARQRAQAGVGRRRCAAGRMRHSRLPAPVIRPGPLHPKATDREQHAQRRHALACRPGLTSQRSPTGRGGASPSNSYSFHERSSRRIRSGPSRHRRPTVLATEIPRHSLPLVPKLRGGTPCNTRHRLTRSLGSTTRRRRCASRSAGRSGGGSRCRTCCSPAARAWARRSSPTSWPPRGA